MAHATLVSAQLSAHFLKGLLATKAGRAHVLNQVADAEATDEGAIFDRLLLYVDDPKLRQMIERHQADELRHAKMFYGCMARTGITPYPVPTQLKLLDRLDVLADGVMDLPVKTSRDVMVAYLMLLVIEERAILQFNQFIPAFERVDRETADVFRSVARDEERHLRYCHAISKRYAPDEATWASELARFRELEEQAFAENSFANICHTFDEGLHAGSKAEGLFWRTLIGLTTARKRGVSLRALLPVLATAAS